MEEEADLFATLKDDYREALEHLNDALLRLESDARDQESLETASRQLHNIKGFANRMRARSLGQLAHILEDLLAAVVQGRFPFEETLADLLFQGMDLFVNYLRTREVPADKVAELLEGSESRLFPASDKEDVGEGLEKLLPDFIAAARDNVAAINQGLFNLENEPTSRESLQEVYRNAHSLKGSALTMGFERMGKLAHRMEDVLRAFQAGSVPVTTEVCDALFEVNDAISVMLDTLAAGKRMRVNVESSLQRLGKFLPEVQTRKEFVGRETVTPAVWAVPEVPATVAGAPAMDTVRVPTGKLDDLVNLAGEAAIGQIRLTTEVDSLGRIRERWHRCLGLRERASARGIEVEREGESGLVKELLAMGDELEETSWRLQVAAESTGRLIDSLQHRTMEIRMLPLALVFNTLPRAVRDLSRQFGKQVNFQVKGTETTLDKRILEQTGDPLIHLLRNALDHGIETPEERRRSGKPETGNILLQAKQEGGKVIITLMDDGLGIDPNHLREVAVKKGFLDSSEAESWSEAQILDLIFLPGFSTSALVTDISGRGVGLDVVRTNVARLKGQVQVASEMGKWTRFVITLPLTLATVHALMIQCAGEVLAVPTLSVFKTFQVPREEIKRIQGRQAIVVENEIIPVRNLAAVLGWQTNGDPKGGLRLMLLLLEAGEKRVAFIVDEILGEREIVTKDLGSHLRKVQFVAGATILGSGEVALILDASQLLWQEIPETREYRPQEEEAGDSGRRRRLILVVEDQVVTRQMEQSILEAAGYDVVTAENGIDAFNNLNQQSFDLVVTDIQMPKMDGFELTEKIRNNERTRNLPVVIVTSMDREEDKRRGLEVGADAYLVKSSFDQRNLIGTIETLLGRRA